MKLIHGDCLKEMFDIPDNSVDMVCCDMPYGTTACKWDTVLPLDMLWHHYKRIVKNIGAIVLFSAQPFTTTLINSNLKWFKYQWVWNKVSKTDVFNAKNKPLRQHEDLCVFSSGTTANKSKRKMFYNPQGVKSGNRTNPQNRKAAGYMGKARPSHKKEHIYHGSNYPSSIIKFTNADRTNVVHPTQKPVALIEYLIKTYTNEGDTVLDNCMGSGTTGVACKNLNRDFIGIELDEKYFEIAKTRIEGTQYNKQINRTQESAPVI